jgi:hypothetical protein
MLIPWLIIVCLKTGREKVFTTIKNFSSILLMSFLMSFYYIVVALSVYSQGARLQPSYVLTYDFLNILSEKTTLVNIFRLMGDWWPRINIEQPIVDYTVWTVLTFIIPISMGLFILFSRSSKLKFYLISFFLISLFIIFIHKGTQPPISEFYPLLYDIPIVGWMFRVPSKIGMILAFFIMMIITLGFYNMFASKTNGIKRHFKYLLLGGFVICISVISWPMFTGNFGGIFQDGQYPEIRATNSSDNTNNISVPEENIAILGGLDKLISLNGLEYFNKEKSSLIFIDQDVKTNLYNMTAIDKLILDDTDNVTMQLLSKNSVIIKPFDSTKRHDPKHVWSIAGTNDPIHGPFHTYLDKLSIKNSDIDYGKGLVLTSAKDKLEIPIKVTKSDLYNLYFRYMKNEQGGTMKIYLDKNPINTINTLDEHNRFVWKNIEMLNLTSGKHTLTLENIRGLNAVNIFVLAPSREIPGLINQMHTLAEKSRNIHILEAESSFTAPDKYNGDDFLFIPSSGTFNKTFVNQLKIPENSDKVSLQFWTKQNPTSPSSYKIKSFEIAPVSNKKFISTSDFEDISEELNYYSSYGNNKISIETKTPISGTKSLRVDVKGDPHSKSWNVVSTDIALVNNTGKVSYQLSVSAMDVNSLHSKAIYYDSNGNEIDANYIFFDTGDKFKNTYSKNAILPQGTKYISIQILAKANSKGAGSYLIDDVKIAQVYPDKSFKNNFEIFGNSYIDGKQNVTINEDSLTVNLKQGNITDWNVVQTKPIKISSDLPYKYKIIVEANNSNSLNSKAFYLTQNVEDSSKNGVQDGLLILKPRSEISTNVDLLKESKYTIATKVKTCEQCSSLIIKIGDTYKLLSLRNDKTDVKWLYFTMNLPAGKTDLRIYSNGETEFDKLIIYSDSYENESLDKLFIQKGEVYHTTLLDYNKINPTHYEVKIDTLKPFILKFSEPYHPLWRIYLNGKEYKPIQLYFEDAKRPQGNVATNYPAINGFIIDQTGRLDLTIEYKPLKWFLLGAIVSIMTFTISLGYLIWERRRRMSYLFKPFAVRIFSTIQQPLKHDKW